MSNQDHASTLLHLLFLVVQRHRVYRGLACFLLHPSPFFRDPTPCFCECGNCCDFQVLRVLECQPKTLDPTSGRRHCSYLNFWLPLYGPLQSMSGCCTTHPLASDLAWHWVRAGLGCLRRLTWTSTSWEMGQPGLSAGCAFTQEAGVADLFRQGQLVAPAGAPADALPIDTAEPDTARIDDVVSVAVETRGVFTVGSPAASWTATVGDRARWPSRPGKVIQSSIVQATWPQVPEDVEGSMLKHCTSSRWRYFLHD